MAEINAREAKAAKRPKDMTYEEWMALPITKKRGHLTEDGFYIPPFCCSLDDDGFSGDDLYAFTDRLGNVWTFEEAFPGEWVRRFKTRRAGFAEARV